ncbi:uncharacterized protein atf7ip2 isoform 2-T2 [Symphorus nematophorus]
MKRLPSESPSPGPSAKKIKFFQSEVQTLIEQEVHSAVKKNETKQQSLIKTIQQLDHRVESSIQKLEARINRLTKKAEAAFAGTTKKEEKSPLSSLVNVDKIRSDSQDETMETVSQNKKRSESMDKTGEVSKMIETTKKAVKKMHADSKALTAAIADLREQPPPPVLPPRSSPKKELVRIIKKDPDDEQENENHVEESKQSEEPKAERMKEECLSPDNSNRPQHTVSNQDKLVYPPLPPTTFPSILNMEAASYNIPQKPDVHLALIKNPPSLSVLWNVKEIDPSAPPMDSYSVCMAMEKVKGSGVFPKWKIIGIVKAIPLPICVMIHKYKPGHKVCVAVVGKDKFGRYGPYSEVVPAAIPE